jgi:hypothetical protein
MAASSHTVQDIERRGVSSSPLSPFHKQTRLCTKCQEIFDNSHLWPREVGYSRPWGPENAFHSLSQLLENAKTCSSCALFVQSLGLCDFENTKEEDVLPNNYLRLVKISNPDEINKYWVWVKYPTYGHAEYFIQDTSCKSCRRSLWNSIRPLRPNGPSIRRAHNRRIDRAQD